MRVVAWCIIKSCEALVASDILDLNTALLHPISEFPHSKCKQRKTGSIDMSHTAVIGIQDMSRCSKNH